ncbi:VOC family protein [Nocardiopsis coralliicola]
MSTEAAEAGAAGPPPETAPNETAVPLLFAPDPDAVVDFYTALGFTVTDDMRKPYLYLALAYSGFGIHFTGPPDGLDPVRSGGASCLVMVDAVAPYHAAFAAGLKARYGKVPRSGHGRITRLRPGASRFTVMDPCGNSIIVIQRDEPERIDYGGSRSLSGLQRVLDNARNLRDFKTDDRAAFRALESGLRRKTEGAAPIDVARALAAQLELAPGLGEQQRIPEIAAALRAVGLTAEERRTVVGELATEHADWAAWLAAVEAEAAE